MDFFFSSGAAVATYTGQVFLRWINTEQWDLPLCLWHAGEQPEVKWYLPAPPHLFFITREGRDEMCEEMFRRGRGRRLWNTTTGVACLICLHLGTIMLPSNTRTHTGWRQTTCHSYESMNKHYIIFNYLKWLIIIKKNLKYIYIYI